MNRRHKILSGIFAAALFATTAHAYVVGEQGSVYPIREKSMTEVLTQNIDEKEMEKFKEITRKRIAKKLPKYRLPNAVQDLPPARDVAVFKVDMTYELPRDIKDAEGNVIYPKGYSFNPLKNMDEHGIAYPQVIVVINADMKEEIKWFRETFAAKTFPTKLLITNGHAYELAQDLGRPVYYLTKQVRATFMIERTPSLVYQPQGEHYMMVQEIPIEKSNKGEFDATQTSDIGIGPGSDPGLGDFEPKISSGGRSLGAFENHSGDQSEAGERQPDTN